MKTRRTKAYVCVDVDFAEHRRFQATRDIDVAIGTWLRCLAHSRAQHQDGVVTDAWVRRTFPKKSYRRIEELVAVGLLLRREDGDYEIHAYAPRNQTRAGIEEERALARERVREWRRTANAKRPDVTPNENVSNAFVPTSSLSSYLVSLDSSLCLSASSSLEDSIDVRAVPRAQASARADRPPLPASEPERTESSLLDEVREGLRRANAHSRAALPRSERSFSGSFWLEAFAEGIREQTGRPCSFGRVYLGTLERMVTHHAPERDVDKASAWLKAEAKAFAALWDGKHPAKGLTPDGLERWLNEGRQGPPVFGRPRLVQPAAKDWHEDDWSDLGAKVDK